MSAKKFFITALLVSHPGSNSSSLTTSYRVANNEDEALGAAVNYAMGIVPGGAVIGKLITEVSESDITSASLQMQGAALSGETKGEKTA